MSINKYPQNWPHEALKGDLTSVMDEIHTRVCKIATYIDLIEKVSDDNSPHALEQIGVLADSAHEKLYGIFDLFTEADNLQKKTTGELK